VLSRAGSALGWGWGVVPLFKWGRNVNLESTRNTLAVSRKLEGIERHAQLASFTAQSRTLQKYREASAKEAIRENLRYFADCAQAAVQD